MSDFIVNLVMSLVTGGYMGIVVSKVVTFAALKREALRIVRQINDIGKYNNTEHVRDIPFIVSDLLGLGHKKAGLELAKIHKGIIEELSQAKQTGNMNTIIIESAQSEIRGLKMSKIILFNPFDFRV